MHTQDRIDVIHPNGKVDTWPANKESLAMAIMLAGGIDNPQQAKAYAADVCGDLLWGHRGEVTYEMPEGNVGFRFVPYTGPEVEMTPRAQLNLALNKHWPWLALVGCLVALYIEVISQ